jgi:hypothetical protein
MTSLGRGMPFERPDPARGNVSGLAIATRSFSAVLPNPSTTYGAICETRSRRLRTGQAMPEGGHRLQALTQELTCR